jgi:hypothetical protein
MNVDVLVKLVFVWATAQAVVRYRRILGDIRARIVFVSFDFRHTSNSGSQQRKSTQRWSRTIRLTSDEKVSINSFSATRSGIREWPLGSTLTWGDDRVAVSGSQIKILLSTNLASLKDNIFSNWLNSLDDDRID